MKKKYMFVVLLVLLILLILSRCSDSSVDYKDMNLSGDMLVATYSTEIQPELKGLILHSFDDDTNNLILEDYIFNPSYNFVNNQTIGYEYDAYIIGNIEYFKKWLKCEVLSHLFFYLFF